MHKITQIIILLIILVLLVWYFKPMIYTDETTNSTTETSSNEQTQSKEGFRVNSQNFVYNNAKETAELMDYGKDDDVKGMYETKPDNPMGPSQVIGVGQNSPQDVYDNRGFKWTSNANNPQIDEFTRSVNDAQLRNKFERMYMLDPDGSVAKYDITYNKISPNCCPAQYAPPFKLTDKDASNCDFAQKYVANQYSGMNFNDGYGCACITPKQADFYGSRGGNTD